MCKSLEVFPSISRYGIEANKILFSGFTAISEIDAENAKSLASGLNLELAITCCTLGLSSLTT